MEGRRPRTRILSLAFLIVLGLGAVVGRLIQLQIVQYGDYLARARRQQQRIVEVSPARGIVYDRNLRELAMSIPEDSCFAVPVEVSDPSLVARLLSGILKMEPEEIETRLTASKSFVWIARKLPPDKVQRIQALNLRGIYFQKESQRFYPKGQLAAHALGYVDIDGRGLGGIEYQYDERLRGKPVQMLVMADALDRAGTTEKDAILKALKRTKLEKKTMVGDPIEFDEKGDNKGARASLMQLQQGKSKIVYPSFAATAKQIYPVPLWEERGIK